MHHYNKCTIDVCVCACMVNNWMQKNPPTIRILNKNPLYVWLGFARARECSAFLSRSFIVSVSWLVSQMTKCLTNYHRASNFCTNTQTRGHKSQSKGRIFIFDNTIIIVIRNANMARAFPLCPQCIYLRRWSFRGFFCFDSTPSTFISPANYQLSDAHTST